MLEVSDETKEWLKQKQQLHKENKKTVEKGGERYREQPEVIVNFDEIPVALCGNCGSDHHTYYFVGNRNK